MQSGHCRTKEKQRELLSIEGCGFHERFSESSRSYEPAELQQHRLEKAVYRLSRGRFSVNTNSRLRGVVVGAGGPDVVIGRATTRGVQQSEFSRKFGPPTKWSYRKLLLWSVAISLAALVVYVRSVMSQPGPASTLPVTVYAIAFPIVLAVLLAVVWRHNHSAYPRQYADWDRSFICQRCGTASQHARQVSLPKAA